ncbi:transporter substrate-binding domain-containing protein [Rhizobium skierniewicense]|uniref:transporter substrate-binding domain-containing protein n=1 Tax=Rhizobium skierniewicense TaxID=984260 RepID=UPI001FAD108E|nr:transporter substrate-binding domain-containing protein [Rhizobium skierniewicense]MCI9868736.1 transporter substrate-binding domain-containing protein [Rhizobium skierniewicense]
MGISTFVKTAAVCLVGATIGFSSVHADQLADIKANGKIHFATEMLYPPFDMLVNGKYEGFCRDLGDLVTSELGVKPEYQDLPWTAVLPGLEAGKFDMTNAPVTITHERMERYTFTLPISDATVGLVKRTGDDTIAKPEDITGKTIAAQKGSAELAELKSFAAKLKDVTVKEYASTEDAYADLAAGRIDAVANGAPLGAYAASKRPELFSTVSPPFGEKSYYAWAARRGEKSTALVNEINTILVKLQDDGRLGDIQKKWFGQVIELPKTFPDVK